MCIQKALQHYHVDSNLKHFTEEYEKSSENMSNTCNTDVTHIFTYSDTAIYTCRQELLIKKYLF